MKSTSCGKTRAYLVAIRLLPLVLSSPLVFACSAKSNNKPIEGPTQAKGLQEEQGNTPEVEIGLSISGSVAVATITNNTATSLLFHSAVQVLDGSGNDVVTPIVGPDATVGAGATSSPFSITIPTLPDGYHEVMLTVLATNPLTGIEVGASGADHLKVLGGVTTVITQAEWYHESGANVAVPHID
ncbi:hypothetical protein OV203_43605 [Nannocystis sp. ILAH1]|uniref:hypothetical protein n=1 Tax=Nannocystis sp. ILAH1 TaxID=2996789 RepID=UPI002270B564|nr:hypothetical protein [Nannocystis sp. ILAH1]MCY0994095.1 hypothetical protein [Nannocystis sp. ILAH1]